MIGEETGKSFDYWLGESIIARESRFHINGKAGRIIKLQTMGKKRVLLHVKNKRGM